MLGVMAWNTGTMGYGYAYEFADVINSLTEYEVRAYVQSKPPSHTNHDGLTH